MKRLPSALLLDLDGTLIGRDERVSPRVAKAVREAARRVPVSIVTGREPADVLRFSRELGLTPPQVCDGGASVLDPASGDYLWRLPLTQDTAGAILESLRSAEAAFIATHPTGVLTHTNGSSLDALVRDFNRISALDLGHEAAEALATRFSGGSGVHAVKSFLPYNGLWAVDFTHAQVNKAVGAAWVVQRAGFRLDAAAAVGDSFNDLPLLEACGVRVVMGDAPDALKAIAHFVAPSVEQDGLAVAIEEFLLPKP
jgi:HAD superfamily hydrolase (TIGR01484 family)